MKSRTLLLCLAAGFLHSTAPAADPAPKPDRERLQKALAAERFWTEPPKLAWTQSEKDLINEMSATGTDPAVRLRATKLLIDFEGKGRCGEGQFPIVVAGFRHMEEHSKEPAIRKLLAGPRLTHYTVSTKGDGSLWLLVESVAPQANRGGINLQWDAAKSKVVAMQVWGELGGN